MLGRISYRIGECEVLDAIFTIKEFNNEEIQLFGHDATYFITVDECWVVKGDVETELDRVTFVSTESADGIVKVCFEKGVRNDFFENN